MNLWRVFQRSLFLRVNAIIICIFLVFFVAFQFLLHTSVFFRLFPNVMNKQAAATAELVFLLENVPDDAAPLVLSTYSGPGRHAFVKATFPPNAKPSEVLGRPFAANSADAFSLDEREKRFRMVRTGQLLLDDGAQPRLLGISVLEVSIELDDGSVLLILLSPLAFLSVSGPIILLGLFVVFSVAVAGALQLAFRPLRRLQHATDALGHTSKPHLVEESGTEDLRRVARAMNDMQQRIQSLLADRSRMLAALAHDIRTGLTHMKLRLEARPSQADASLLDDINHMEQLVGDMLLFARAEKAPLAPELLDVNTFLRHLVDSLPYAVQTDLGEQHYSIAAEPSALRRAILNLLENANTHGKDVELLTVRNDDGLDVVVRDQGPGIPEDALKQIFDPFFRVDGSRNRDTGGSGLGLAIARDLLSAQGATLTISNRPSGGVSAVVSFSNECLVN